MALKEILKNMEVNNMIVFAINFVHFIREFDLLLKILLGTNYFVCNEALLVSQPRFDSRSVIQQRLEVLDSGWDNLSEFEQFLTKEVQTLCCLLLIKVDVEYFFCTD